MFFSMSQQVTRPNARQAVAMSDCIQIDSTSPPLVEAGKLHLVPTKAKANDQQHVESHFAPAALRKREPSSTVNYLELRRNQHSHAAALRNQQIQRAGQEIIAPSPPKPAGRSRVASFHQRIEKLANNNSSSGGGSLSFLSSTKPEILSSPAHAPEAEATEAATWTMIQKHAEALDFSREFDDRLREFERKHESLEQEKLQQQRQVDQLIASIRTDCLAFLYRFTPFFKLFARIQLHAAVDKWKLFVEWHRQERDRLQALEFYAIPIQRFFRKRRQQKQAHRRHVLALVKQWRAVVCMVIKAKKALTRARKHIARRHLAAARIQAIVRGHFARKSFKSVLRETLRALLKELSPTRDLFRLHEVALYHHELASWLSRMMSLEEETPVQIQQRQAKKALPVPTAIHLEVSNSHLLRGILETKVMLDRRQQEVASKKQVFSEQKQKQLASKANIKETEKLQQLQLTYLRLREQQEQKQMFGEELAMKDFVRMEQTMVSDAILRAKIRQRRSEQEANEKMVVEEYQMRYYLKFSSLYHQEHERIERELKIKRKFEYDQQQELLRQHLQHLEEFETKKMEIHHKKQLEREQDQLKWAKETKIQLEQVAKRFEQRQMVEHFRNQQDQLREMERERQRVAILMERESKRTRHQQELEREAHERGLMEIEEKRILALHFAQKKQDEMALWEARRAEATREYYLDPMNFDKLRARKQQEEIFRRERYAMALEEKATRKIMEYEAKVKRLEAAKERERIRQKELRFAKREIPLMLKEDEEATGRRATEQKALNYRQTLEKMHALAAKDAKRRDELLSEAKNRKEMHEEELRQHRWIQNRAVKQTRSEKYENHMMQQVEQQQREVEVFVAKRERKRLREHNILQMMKEDARSLCREEWEAEGVQLEKMLWPDPSDRLAFSHVVHFHWDMLRLNVLFFRKVGCVEMMPPFELDYDAVHRHRAQESTMTLDQVPPKKRKPRKFFYHEFFEEDPLTLLLQKQDVKQSQHASKSSRARQHWQKLSEHFLSSHWGKVASTRGFELMKQECYEQALAEMMKALISWEKQPKTHKRSVPVVLLHHLARCYFALWRKHLLRSYLQKCAFFFSCASQDLMLLCNATFLFELARSLEDQGELKSAARILGYLIECFPKFDQLNLVIFRAGVIMMALRMFKQSREYLMHTMDSKPYGFEPFEIVFVVARILQLEKQTRMASIAYEEAFRKNLLQNRREVFEKYGTWQQWINDCQTWRVFGDRFFQQQEFLLAKDAYQLVFKRRSLRDARVAGSDHDWLRLARIHAIFNDRATVQNALGKWVRTKSYAARIEEKYNNWPPVRWKLLGVAIPPGIEAAYAAKQKQDREEEAKRAERRIARVNHSIAMPVARPNRSQEELDAWKVVPDEESGGVYYWNELTDEVSWDIPF